MGASISMTRPESAIREALTFDDVLLVPAHPKSFPHRSIPEAG
jgi:IMP dehydrogenase/GMP reductase